MIRMDLQMFGGRGGDSTSANWTKGFLKSVRRNIDDDEDYYDAQAASNIYKRLNAKNKDKVEPRGGWDPYAEGRVLKDWAKDSDVALYNESKNKLTISPGKLSTARREFERYVKGRFKKYYKRGTAVKKK